MAWKVWSLLQFDLNLDSPFGADIFRLVFECVAPGDFSGFADIVDVAAVGERHCCVEFREVHDDI